TGAAIAIKFGPFDSGDRWEAVLTGMVFVAAMAIQNAIHRVYLSSAPPSTLMTGTTTQIMIDVADAMLGHASSQGKSSARMGWMSAHVLAFALGCGVAALLFMRVNVWCFAVPPLIATASLVWRILGDRKVSPRELAS